jgi:hypothetical protein
LSTSQQQPWLDAIVGKDARSLIHSIVLATPLPRIEARVTVHP